MNPEGSHTQQVRTEAQLVGRIETYMSKEAAAVSRLLDATGPELEFVQARAGGWGVLCDGVTLDSTYDPAGQAADLVATQDLSETELVVLIGCGGGELPRAVFEATTQLGQAIAVFEPEPAVLRGMFERFDGLEALEPSRLQFFTQPQSLKLFVATTYRDIRGVTVIFPPAYRRLHPSLVESLSMVLRKGMELAVVSRNTEASRGREWVRNALRNLRHKTEHPSIYALQNRFAGVPAVIAAAGPSLDKNLHLLAEANDHVVVFAVNTALRAVLRAGITPHFVTSLEALNVSAQFEGLERELADLTLVLDEAGHPSLFSMPTARKFTFLEASAPYVAFAKKVDPQAAEGICCGASVANATFSVARLLGCDPIILVGQDLAYTEGRVYAAETVFGDLTFHESSGANTGTVTDPRGIKQRILDESGADVKEFWAERYVNKVKSWDGQGEVTTSSDFNLFREWFQEMAVHLTRAEGMTLINATEGGAYIDGFEHLTLKEALARHATPRPAGELEQIIIDHHAHARRLAPLRCEQALHTASDDYRELNKTVSRAAKRLQRVVEMLVEHGSESAEFSSALTTFEQAELQVRDQATHNPLVEPYISGRVTKILQDRAWMKGDEALRSKWHRHLDQSGMVLAAVREATLELIDELAAIEAIADRLPMAS